MHAHVQNVPLSLPRNHAVIPLPGSRVHGPPVAWESTVRAHACEARYLNATCIPAGMDAAQRQAFVSLISPPRRLAAGEYLFRTGDVFGHLYYIKVGAVKSVMLLHDGREQVMGFHLAGNTLGLDAIGSNMHPTDAVALQETWICTLPYQNLMQLAGYVTPVQHYVQRLLSLELNRDQSSMVLLGRIKAAERVAAFLIGLAQRYRSRGFSPSKLVVPMARADIGNYLGLTLETISRCLTRFKNAGLIAVDNRHLHILDPEGLKKVIGPSHSRHGSNTKETQ